MKRLISCTTLSSLFPLRSSFLFLFFYPLLLLLLSACGGGETESKESQVIDPHTGSILFSVRWNPSGDQAVTVGSNHAVKALSSCDQEGVTRIQCSLYSSTDALLIEGADLPCANRRGALDGIPPGRDLKVVCQGWDADQNVLHLGRMTGINVVAGEIADVGVLDFFSFIPAPMTPQDGATVRTNAFSLNWESVYLARKYEVQISESANFETLVMDEVTTETTYEPTRLLPDTTYYWRVKALDFLETPGSNSRTYSFTTLPGSSCRPPILTPIGNQAVPAGSALTLDLTAQDPDEGDTLTFSSNVLPTGAALDPVSGRFEWDTLPGDKGYYKMIFKVCDNCPDGLLCDTEEVYITVGETCLPPVLEKIGPRHVPLDESFSLTLFAESPTPNAKLSYYANNLPQGARFTPYLQTFFWNTYPVTVKPGNYQVNFGVCNECTDRTVCDTEQVTFSVGNVCRPPELERIGSQRADVGIPLILRLKANDPDSSGELTFSADEEFASFIDPDTGIFSWTAGNDDALRRYKVRLQVCDTCAAGPLCDWEDVSITVGEGCQPPVLDLIGPQQGMEMGMPPIKFTVSASDPDPESVLTYNEYDLPPWKDYDPLPQSYLWMPSWGSAGTYHTTFEVCDDCPAGPLCDSEEVEITMLPYCPDIEICDSDIFQEVAVGERLEFKVRTNNTDVWNNIWIYEAYDVTGSNIAQYFDPQTRIFSWKPTAADVGSHQINFRVCDVCPSGQQCDDETFMIDVLKSHLSQPLLVEPADKAMLDNGCLNAKDPISWSFAWKPVTGADHYEISILQGGQTVITQIVSEPYYKLNCSKTCQKIPECHVIKEDLEDWAWKVRAVSKSCKGGYFSLWSEVRNFTISPLNCK